MNASRRTRAIALRALTCAAVFALGCASTGTDGRTDATPPGATERLQRDLDALAAGADPAEARMLATTAVAQSARLAAEYRMTRPALWNNVLVNVGVKARGLCWHWTEDLLAALSSLRLRSYQLHWGTAHRDQLFREHNSVIVTARGEPLAQGIVLDPWRTSGRLHWVAVVDDRYPWRLR